MKLKLISFLASCALVMQAIPCTASAEEPTLTDSGIDYTESVQTISNPGAGYTSTLWYRCKPGDTPVYNPTGSLVVMFIDIGAFSSGVNGTTDDAGNYTEGVDYDLDESFFQGIRATLENCRNNGCTAALRFRYDANGKTNPEPASFDQVLAHIQQISDSGILQDYEDILMYVESGFVGAWGEQHSGKYTSLEYKAQLLDALLKVVPKSIPVTVRTPNTFCTWAGIEMSQLVDYVAEEGSDAARVGIYNDGYMGSDTDLGTFINPSRADSVAWMKNQMLHTYYGGEFSGNIDYAKKYETYLPENAIQEMYDTHLSYINSNIWSLYKDYTFGESCDTSGADNSAYYGQTVYQFMRDHIGYRFVLRDSDLTAETTQGGNVTVAFDVENTGFASPIKAQKAQVILEKDGYYIITDSDLDDRAWYSTTISEETLNLKLPGNIESGDWKVYLKLSVGENDITSPQRTVQFANQDIYNKSIGANYLGTVHVAESQNDSDNTFCEEGADPSDGTVYTYRDHIVVDGAMSQYEWADSTLVKETEDSKLYLSYDNENLYLCAVLPGTAESPVYNLSMKGTDDEKQYWIYYQSNGFIYFNHDDYSGVECKYHGGTVEFKIPNAVMNLHPEKTLEYLRIDIQDSSHEWVVTGDIRIENYFLAGVPEPVQGDINGDGAYNLADLVALQKWLICDEVTLADWQAGDLNGNGRLDAFDLCLMRQMQLKYLEPPVATETLS